MLGYENAHMNVCNHVYVCFMHDERLPVTEPETLQGTAGKVTVAATEDRTRHTIIAAFCAALRCVSHL